jgi:malonate-semialdehyde dehydrogenase (acetylating)/methylmalonate-semialdehyde dehydrogenase
MDTLTLKYPKVQQFINGHFVDAVDDNYLEVVSPLDGSLLSTVPLGTAETLDQAVQAAKTAFPLWSAIPIKERVQVFYQYMNLLRKNIRELSELICEEGGKTGIEARAEIEKSIELTEFACSLPQIIGGEVLEVSQGVECRTERYPVGVVASIVPFNFPSMVPHWTIPNALVLGNTMIIKPSEQVPLSVLRIAAMLKEAGLPDGVFNVVNGDKTVVEAICDHPDIAAISFVGSTKVAKIVYTRGTANLKRVLALGGAKNHLIVLPDAVPSMTASNIVASVTGCCGQRCMAASIMVGVGEVDHIVDLICEEAQKVVPGKNLGAVISSQAKHSHRKVHYRGRDIAGGRVLVDGRNAVVPGKEAGYYVGPTIIDNVTADMAIAREEVFGPVLAIVRASKPSPKPSTIENRNPYGNATGVFTQNGSAARYVAERCQHRHGRRKHRRPRSARTLFVRRLE